MRKDVLERCDEAGMGQLALFDLRVQGSMVPILARDEAREGTPMEGVGAAETG